MNEGMNEANTVHWFDYIYRKTFSKCSTTILYFLSKYIADKAKMLNKWNHLHIIQKSPPNNAKYTYTGEIL